MDLERVVYELMDAARMVGVVIREFGPADEPRPPSGLCRLKGQTTLFLETNLDPRQRIAMLRDALRGQNLEDVFLSPAARACLDDNSAPGEDNADAQ